MSRFIEHVKGRDVVGTQGHMIGIAVDLEFSKMSVKGLVVRVESKYVKALGLKKPFWSRATMVVPMELVKAFSDVITLEVGLDDLAPLLAKAEPVKAEGKKAL